MIHFISNNSDSINQNLQFYLLIFIAIYENIFYASHRFRKLQIAEKIVR